MIFRIFLLCEGHFLAASKQPHGISATMLWIRVEIFGDLFFFLFEMVFLLQKNDFEIIKTSLCSREEEALHSIGKIPSILIMGLNFLAFPPFKITPAKQQP